MSPKNKATTVAQDIFCKLLKINQIFLDKPIDNQIPNTYFKNAILQTKGAKPEAKRLRANG
jgi:hypothetical protein